MYASVGAERGEEECRTRFRRYEGEEEDKGRKDRDAEDGATETVQKGNSLNFLVFGCSKTPKIQNPNSDTLSHHN